MDGCGNDDLVRIIDPNTGKVRDAKRIKVVSHPVADAEGEVMPLKCVEFVIVGNNRNWVQWSEYEVFKKWNTHLEV